MSAPILEGEWFERVYIMCITEGEGSDDDFWVRATSFPRMGNDPTKYFLNVSADKLGINRLSSVHIHRDGWWPWHNDNMFQTLFIVLSHVYTQHI